MSIVADEFRFVVGVDTHAATHSYAIIGCPAGVVVAEAQFPTTPAGLARAAAWIGRRTGGDLDQVLVSTEGTRAYGARLGRLLADTGYRVVEAPTPSAKRLRGKGKTDRLDAVTAARSTLALQLSELCDRRGDGVRDALQTLTTLRDHLNLERLAVINALTALTRSHDLGIDARRALTTSQIRQIARQRPRHGPVDTVTAHATAVRHARRFVDLDTELAENRRLIHALVTEHVPALLALHGVGPITAATIYTVWSHPGRIRSEAALASLAGTCPIPASSGNTDRHRLNRGGDRRLNKAINTIVLTRWRNHPDTRDYIARRRAEGKTNREIRRCLRRYATRQIYRTLNTIDIT